MQFDSFIRYWGFHVVEVLCIEYITYCENYVGNIIYFYISVYVYTKSLSLICNNTKVKKTCMLDIYF